MGKKLLLVSAVLIAIAYLTFYCQNKTIIFLQGIEFTPNDQWLFVHQDNFGKQEIISDAIVLAQLKAEIIVWDDENCHATTPDYCLSIFKNGIRLKSFCYCEWQTKTIDFGSASQYLKRATTKRIETNSIEHFKHIIDSIDNRNTSHINFMPKTESVFDFHFKIMVTIPQEMIVPEIETILRKEFIKYQPTENYELMIRNYSSSQIRRKYELTISCTEKIYAIFELNTIKQSKYFKAARQLKLLPKKYSLSYLEELQQQ